MKKIIALLAFSGALAFASFAQCGAQIRLTDMIQQERIDGGVKSGKLTNREGRQLQRQLFKLRKKRMRYLADGRLSRRERHKLARKHKLIGARIYREKHDAQRAR